MSDSMTKRERLARVLAGQEVDRLPVSLWRHFCVEETSSERLSARLAAWHRRFDFDFLKINVRAEVHAETWGSTYSYSGQEHQRPQLKASGVQAPGDLAALQQRDPWSWPLGDMVDIVRRLRRILGDDEVLVMTVFNPLSVVYDLLGGAAGLAVALDRKPSAVHTGLRVIADTLRDYVRIFMKEGCDGVFLATTHVATADMLTREQLEEFVRPYDLEILDAAKGAFLNVLHVCQKRSYVRELADYPVGVIQWDSREAGNPSLAQMRGLAGGKALMGGLSSARFAEAGAGPALVAELDEARRQMQGQPFIVSSTCTIPTTSLEENVDAVVAALR